MLSEPGEMAEAMLPIVFSAQPEKLDATSPNDVVPGILVPPAPPVDGRPPPDVGKMEPRVHTGQ